MTKKNKKVHPNDLYHDGMIGLLVYLPIPNELLVIYIFNHSMSFIASDRLECKKLGQNEYFEVIDYVRLY